MAPGPADGVTTIGHAADGVLYFPGAAGGLWRSDGTAAGTSRLADLTPWRIIADGNRLYVAVLVDYERVDLFRIDLPSGATTLLGSFHGDQIEPSLTLLGGRLFFAADTGHEGLWTSDGTPEGTRLVRAAQLATGSEGGNEKRSSSRWADRLLRRQVQRLGAVAQRRHRGRHLPSARHRAG